MYMKSYVYIVAWLILIVVAGCKVRDEGGDQL